MEPIRTANRRLNAEQVKHKTAFWLTFVIYNSIHFPIYIGYDFLDYLVYFTTHFESF